jgi:hypothetical protein
MFHYNTVSNVETGRYGADPETLAAIKKALEKAGVEFTNGKKPGVRVILEAAELLDRYWIRKSKPLI